MIFCNAKTRSLQGSNFKFYFALSLASSASLNLGELQKSEQSQVLISPSTKRSPLVHATFEREISQSWLSRESRCTVSKVATQVGLSYFGGGLPIRREGVGIGAIGTSAGTVEQDIQVAEAAVGAIQLSIQPASVGVS